MRAMGFAQDRPQHVRLMTPTGSGGGFLFLGGSPRATAGRTDMTDLTNAKFIGFFRLIDACDGAGCPVCRCVVADSRQYLDTLLYEQVNDPETRSRLRASWGFCNWHAWMLREASNPAFGSAILSENMVRVVIRRFERLTGRLAGGGGPFA